MQNSITLTGKVNYQPRIISSKSGNQCCSFQLGVYDGKDASGKSKYFNINVMVFEEHIVNGLMDLTMPANIVVTGRLAGDSYTNKEGKTVRSVKVIANSVGVDL